MENIPIEVIEKYDIRFEGERGCIYNPGFIGIPLENTKVKVDETTVSLIHDNFVINLFRNVTLITTTIF
jgi:hypothetical protein